LNFVAKRFVFLTGIALATPLFPLYYVRTLNASDAWIGVFNTAQTAVLVVGYLFWVNQSRRGGSRRVLLIATLGMSLYPALIAFSQHEMLVALISGLSGVFQAGINLVFFDELMNTIPPDYSATFVAVAQSLQYLSTIFAPLIGTTLADVIGIGGALIVSSIVLLIGFAWFALGRSSSTPALAALPVAEPEPLDIGE
jgi:MFS family permease